MKVPVGVHSATLLRTFPITTSGFFSVPAPLCCVQDLAWIDHVSVDYPFDANRPGTAWLPIIPLCAEDPRQDRERQRHAAAEAVTDPFVRPQVATAADAIAAIGDELAVFDDWTDRYQFIIDSAASPLFPTPGLTMRIACEDARARRG